ncbi:hypothetical protein [Neobacillus sp. OS1-33]|uniref:hypothetical protein n=1 Tax=Neobacillus sp. OS1-33 TaxID=3070683 RepID=UPI0027DFD430|nr:hypothetical protein [Neobacillus sp. OS1-33]WML26271.1 hypothetical protein RCG22_01085 [Neobacillus sp. OS1-33]
MKLSKLSPPRQLHGASILEKINNIFYEFNEIFIKKEGRPYLNGKFIFFNISTKYKGRSFSYPERFMHACSIIEKDTHTMFPCNNDISYELCHNKCQCNQALDEFQVINRGECLYRLARIHWVPEVIELANQKDERIRAWSQNETDSKKNKIRKHYIRYECGMDDFLIIFKEDWRNKTLVKYDFITAFPIFLKHNKEQYDKNYAKFKKSTVVTTVP